MTSRIVPFLKKKSNTPIRQVIPCSRDNRIPILFSGSTEFQLCSSGQLTSNSVHLSLQTESEFRSTKTVNKEWWVKPPTILRFISIFSIDSQNDNWLSPYLIHYLNYIQRIKLNINCKNSLRKSVININIKIAIIIIEIQLILFLWYSFLAIYLTLLALL